MSEAQTEPLTEAGLESGEGPIPARDEAGNDFTVKSLPPAAKDQGPAGSPRPSEKRLDASVMTLQAITWSRDPEGCFALVDNQIVRRGDAVAGYEIKEIFEDHVVVGKGGDNWRVEFRNR